MRKLSIERMQKIAAKNGGKCLSDKYINAHTKLLWECSKGHRWEATPNKIQQGRWCPTCGIKKRAKALKLSIDEMHILARKRGGKCLSSVYFNSRSKLLWECEEGHRWEATPNNIQRGKWCPCCGGSMKLTIEEMRQIAKTRGGKCLSKKYINNQTKLLWECAEGHRWEALPYSIKSGSWCRKCAGLEKLTIEDMQKVAEKRGGKCFSKKYPNARTKLLWECSEKHQWKATWDKIGQGRWCPECSAGLGERISRENFNQLFRNNFPKARPKWLLNKEGNQMELDGYCEPIGLSFEHQGEHHYTTKTHYLTTKSDLSKRKRDDKLKRKLCNQKGITLIIIPEIPNRLSINEVKNFIKKQCRLKGFPLPSNFNSIKVDLRNTYSTPISREILNELQIIAKNKGGKCLSKAYKGDNIKLLWECNEGHQWRAVPSSIKMGTWCRYCAKTVKKTIEQMRYLAKERGGKCLSKSYAGVHKKLLWQCPKGHRWEAAPTHIITGHWCPYCVGRGKTIEDMQRLAKKRNGICLSKIYNGARKKLLWQCSKGHQWMAVPFSIKQGSWCPHCFKQRKKSVKN
jgi:hypothetical protein